MPLSKHAGRFYFHRLHQRELSIDMPSEDSEKAATTKQSDPDAPSPDSVFSSGSSISESHSRVGRLRAWVSAHLLFVEASLALVSVGFGILAVPLVTFGSLLALGGETRIVAAGIVVVLVGASVVVSLAVLLLIHARLDLHRGDIHIGDDFVRSVAYSGSRVLQTLTAGILLLSLLASAVSLIVRNSVPDPLVLVVGAGGVFLPPLVLAHATGRFVGIVIDSE